MGVINEIREKAKSKLKTIVLPEFEDERILEAASIIEKEKIANVILLTKDKID
ncbi:MAG: phosphate acetyltransferase, partial [Candidatus Omnitrophica bacterium]|nr:phosphate acetyltransferase [Candidatus Omnitrophota bacterium]